MATIQVKAGGSIMGANRVLFVGGQIMTNVDPEHAKEHIRSGFAIPVGAEKERSDVVQDRPGIAVPPAIPTVIEGGEKVNPPIELLQTTVPSEPPEQIPSADRSVWVIDPSLLKGKTVDQLNVMVLERDKNQPPFEDAKEAIAFLSQDFKQH